MTDANPLDDATPAPKRGRRTGPVWALIMAVLALAAAFAVVRWML